MRKGASKKRVQRSVRRVSTVDFTRAIQPHRYAKLRSGYKYTVMLEPEIWSHFGSAEAVKAALRGLISVSRHVRATG